MKWELKEVSRNVHEIRADGGNGIPLWVLLISDLHWDNPKCNRTLLKRHLDEAKESNSPIIVVGDSLCLMQGKFDKRSSKDDIRPEHANNRYLDSIVETAANWFEPYKKQLALLCRGNHEESILKHHETDILDRIATTLRDRGGITRTGGYGGFVRFMVSRGHGNSKSLVMYYHHGFGGGGPITQGVIDASRYIMAARADVLVCGHVHQRNRLEIPCVGINDASRIETRSRHFIRCGTYKDEFDDGYGGFHVEKGRGPRPLGGWWMRIMLQGREGKLTSVFQETDS